MQFEWDMAKSARNATLRNLLFERVYDFNWSSAAIQPSFRDGERRYMAAGYLDERLHMLCFLPMESKRLRIISLRKAKAKVQNCMDANSEEYMACLTDDDGEVRELTAEDFAHFRPIQEFPEIWAIVKDLKQPTPDQPEPVEIAPDVVRAFRSRGETSVGEQVNSALRDWLRDHAA